MARLSFLIGCLLICATSVHAQTKKIAHRSHSGKPNTFAYALGDDNFGLFVPEEVRRTKDETKVKKTTPTTIDPVTNQPVPEGESNPVEKTQEEVVPVDETAPLEAEPDDAPHKAVPPSIQDPNQGSSGNSVSPQTTPQENQGNSHAVRFRPAEPEPGGMSGGIVLLFGLMLFPVAPGVMLLAAVWGPRKQS